MSKINLTDDDLRRYITRFDNLKIDSIYENEKDFNYEFSSKFEDKMQKLIKDTKKKSKISRLYSGKKLVASLCIIFICIFTLSMSVEAIRVKVIDVIKEIYSEFTMFKISEDQDTTLQDDLNNANSIPEPNYLPSDFKEIEKTYSDNGALIIYEGTNSTQIGYEVNKINSGTFILDTEDAVVESININGFEAQYIQKFNFVQLFWNDDNYTYSLDKSFLSEDITPEDKSEIIKIAESIKK